ncbi:nucleotidyltransferase domain-containing protein [Candidatus Shapirobacteria bacterium CG03_land_8_20_14_0_80_35_14]|uniref:Nucleotidyltransferase domain-containing protein n=1 Tax=Candidatus Shapirobacteria bacterium CG03_land_8_20_14_0_80_35_14 TaxID=1974878 RepID=A0A2M7BNH9_9BACT|nr:MAG: nucleotidyltransferase domain-containing protein [Candidatus Shapirobacteria bacterium CG03_land_8_20_14_0_80_35_14]
MYPKHYPFTKLKSDLLKITAKHVNLNKYKFFIFGSRVTETGDDRSDIDIGILGKKQLSSSILYSIKEEIDNLPTLYSFDLVDFSTVSDSFRQVATKNVYNLN